MNSSRIFFIGAIAVTFGIALLLFVDVPILIGVGGAVLLTTYYYIIQFLDGAALFSEAFSGERNKKFRASFSMRALFVGTMIVGSLIPVLVVYVTLWRIYSVLKMGLPPLGVISLALLGVSALMFILMKIRKRAKRAINVNHT